ncbi:MAG: Zn-dependent hydrolase [Pseudomonadota bacterium]
MSELRPRAAGLAPDLPLAERLFAELRARTADASGAGVTRMSYGPGEAAAHEIVYREASALGLTLETDAARNLYLTLPGAEEAPRLVIGSHLDSVPRGGNYDGAAGVLMGLSVVSGLVATGCVPPQPITVMAIRAEESAWFSSSYIGSRAAFGRLAAAELDTVRRAGDGQQLGAAIEAAGGSATAVAEGLAFLTPDDIAAYIEPHIEQGPVLAHRGAALGLVTDIRGSRRYRAAICTGAYAHSGTTPRALRRDAVVAVAELVSTLDETWQRMEADGQDLTVTFGQIATDPAEASFSKVAGHVGFSLDIRSNAPSTLEQAEAELRASVAQIEQERHVVFDLGPRTFTEPAFMDRGVIAALHRAARRAGHEIGEMPSGAGHDAATFASLGVPTGMLFLRNLHGSHNPDEHMDMADFQAGAEVLLQYCLDPQAPSP